MFTTLDAIVTLFRSVVGFLTSLTPTSFALAQTRIEQTIRNHTVFETRETDAMAADVTTERTLFRVPDHMLDGIEIVSVQYNPGAAVTADANDFATVIVGKRDNAGGARTTIASRATDLAGGSWVAFISAGITVSGVLATRTVPVGSHLTFEVTKAMAGVVVPRGSIEVVYREL